MDIEKESGRKGGGSSLDSRCRRRNRFQWGPTRSGRRTTKKEDQKTNEDTSSYPRSGTMDSSNLHQGWTFNHRANMNILLSSNIRKIESPFKKGIHFQNCQNSILKRATGTL